jgi:hypothetical protein
MDDSGMSDPFARVSFLTQSLRTENIKKSLCPTWDQTLIFEEFEIHGNPRTIEAQPPDIYIELFDHDTFVSTYMHVGRNLFDYTAMNVFSVATLLKLCCNYCKNDLILH